jgi:predicted RNase H-like HicB family nuclease
MLCGPAAAFESIVMEHVIQLHIEKLPEGAYLATSHDVQGAVAQGRTIQETIEIARDVAKKLIEAQSGTAGDSQASGSSPKRS